MSKVINKTTETLSDKRILVLLPYWTIFVFYLKAILIGSWIVFKWIIGFLWAKQKLRSTFINQRRHSRSRSDKDVHYKRSGEETVYYGVLNDKPPSCLIDNRYGRHSYVKLKDGPKLHYVEAGKIGDPVVLLLHGFPDCWLGWRYQINELSRFFHVIALDLKGVNDSDKPMLRNEYTPKKICRELHQFIVSLGAHSVTIIGHDLGALIGWTFAHTHPENVHRFVCISAPHPNLMWDTIDRDTPTNLAWLKFVQLPLLPEMELQHSSVAFLQKCLPHQKKESLEMGDQFQDAYRYIFSRKNDWSGSLNYYRNWPFYRISADKYVRCPCLIITGSQDTCRLDAMVKSTDYCSNFIVKIIEGANHFPHQQMADEFNEVLLNFLVGRRGSRPPSPPSRTPSRGLMERVIGVVSNGVKMANNIVLDSVHQRATQQTINRI